MLENRLNLPLPTFDIDGDYAAYCAGEGEGDKVYPTEFYVLETVQGGEDQKRQQHIRKPRDRAFEQSVLRLLEAYERADEHGHDFDCYIHGHNDFVLHGCKADDYGKNQHRTERYEGCKQYGFENVGDVVFDQFGFFHTTKYDSPRSDMHASALF